MLVRNSATGGIGEGKTFDVVAEAVSEHLVPQFGDRLNSRRLVHIVRISADSSLTKADEDGLDG